MPAVVGLGSVWIANTGDGTISRIDPARATVVATIRTGDRSVFLARNECTGDVHNPQSTSFTVRACDTPSSIAIGAGAVWAAKNEANAIVRVDPASNAVTDTVPLGGKPWALVASDEAVWISDWDDDALIRVDPASRRVAARIDGLAHGPSEMALAPDALWVLNQRAGAITRVDPRTARVVSVIPLANDPQSVTLVGSEVWVRTYWGKLFRIDATTNRVVGVSETASGPGRPGIDRPAVTADGVWLPGISLTRVNASSLDVRQRVDVSCYGVTADANGFLWVLDVAGRVLKIER